MIFVGLILKNRTGRPYHRVKRDVRYAHHPRDQRSPNFRVMGLDSILVESQREKSVNTTINRSQAEPRRDDCSPKSPVRVSVELTAIADKSQKTDSQTVENKNNP
jgi:hypothetical protein